jgi:chromosome segregation protein
VTWRARKALKSDAAGAIEQLDLERRAIELRLEDSEAQGARIAAELTRHEAASREAEAALAELLARQAAMRAERRVAEAALDAARAQLERTEQERAKLADQLQGLGDGAEQIAARDSAAGRCQVSRRGGQRRRDRARQRRARARCGRRAA